MSITDNKEKRTGRIFLVELDGDPAARYCEEDDVHVEDLAADGIDDEMAFYK